jgi:hypothetical protein
MVDYDIKARYDEFNRKYFASELPEIPVSFSKLKRMGGKVDFKVNRLAGQRPSQAQIVHSSIRLTLSDTYKKSSENLDGILLHEMVHVYIISVLNNWKEGHGSIFMKKLREISKLSGINVPLKDDTTDLEANIDKIKSFVVIMFETPRGDFTYNLISPTTYNNDRQNLEKYCDLYVNRYKERVTIYWIKSMAWTIKSVSATVQRKIKARYRLMDPSLLDDLQKNGQVLYKNP